MLNQEQVDTVLGWVATACDIAEVDAPGVSFDLRGGVAGQHWPSKGLIQINSEMCSRYFDRFRDEVVIHEVAHYVDFKRYGSRKNARGQFIHHDEVFRDIMRELGSDKTSTTHDFEVIKTRVQRKWNYYCDCVLDDDVTTKGCTTSTVIHNRIQKKGQTRICHGCGYHFSKKDFRHEVV